MSFIGVTSVPFDQCDTDSITLDATGNTCDALFTNLTRTTQREILIRNRGEQNVLFGKSLADARWPIEPGDALRLAARDLAKIALKTASGSCAVDIIQVI